MSRGFASIHRKYAFSMWRDETVKMTILQLAILNKKPSYILLIIQILGLIFQIFPCILYKSFCWLYLWHPLDTSYQLLVNKWSLDKMPYKMITLKGT